MILNAVVDIISLRNSSDKTTVSSKPWNINAVPSQMGLQLKRMFKN